MGTLLIVVSLWIADHRQDCTMSLCTFRTLLYPRPSIVGQALQPFAALAYTQEVVVDELKQCPWLFRVPLFGFIPEEDIVCTRNEDSEMRTNCTSKLTYITEITSRCFFSTTFTVNRLHSRNSLTSRNSHQVSENVDSSGLLVSASIRQMKRW